MKYYSTKLITFLKFGNGNSGSTMKSISFLSLVICLSPLIQWVDRIDCWRDLFCSEKEVIKYKRYQELYFKQNRNQSCNQ